VLSLNSLIHRVIGTTSEDRSEVSIQMYVYDMKRKTLSRKKEKIIFVVRLLLLYVCYKIMTKVVKEKKIERMIEIVKRKEDQRNIEGEKK
jgi:hypothetical protein